MFEVKIDRPFDLFNSHINKPDNKQILFSAPFGYGKTYFLDRYFKAHSEKYNTFWLSPVRYVVGQNEDIFEYIKIDIILILNTFEEILGEKLNSYSDELYMYRYMIENPNESKRLVFEAIERAEIPIVKGIAGSISGFIKAKETFESWKKQATEDNKNRFQKLHAYANSQQKIRGSIYEEDITTELIKGGLQIIKNNKENVLIIDDFDRLDPEHIFRILNILSVHQDHSTGQDKFGFDKIIIVCSFKNIENIYKHKHKYGSKVDFTGYIEKFYSADIFNFNNQAAVALYCQQNFESDLNSSMVSTLGIILSTFVLKGKLSIRSILKHQKISDYADFGYKYPMPEQVDKANIIYERDTKTPATNQFEPGEFVWTKNYVKPVSEGVTEFYINSSDFHIIKIIQILITICGDYDSLILKINEITDDSKPHCSFPSKYCNNVMSCFLPFLAFINAYHRPDKLFMELKSEQISRPVYSMMQNVFSIYPPITTVFDTGIELPVGWNENNPYDGDESFYSLVSENLLKEREFTGFHSVLQDRLINLLKVSVEYLEKNDLLKRIDVSH